jgi:tetratricopeptide (TPR) repeat protein
MDAHYQRLAVTTRSGPAIEAIGSFADELLSHGNDCRVIFDALAADSECALGHAYAAALYLTAMTREGQLQAAPHIAAARLFAPNASERERMTVNAISAWSDGDDTRAIAVFRSVVEIWPHDIVAAKFCQILELGSGDVVGMLRTSAMAASVDDRAGFALGLHAFALEQNGNVDLALRFARRAIEVTPGRDPWAQHAAAHALAAMDQPVEGRAFLHAHAHDWDRCSSFMLTHNWWHMALFSLELGDSSGALNMFDERIWGVRKEHCQDQINAIALLARLEMAGVKVGWRWGDIAAHVEKRANDRVSDFLDLHYLYALARAGNDVATGTLAEALEIHSLSGRLSGLARGLVAHARGDYLAAAKALGPVRPYLAQIGGSNIQRALIHEMFAHSLCHLRRVHRVPTQSWKQAA